MLCVGIFFPKPRMEEGLLAPEKLGSHKKNDKFTDPAQGFLVLDASPPNMQGCQGMGKNWFRQARTELQSAEREKKILAKFLFHRHFTAG